VVDLEFYVGTSGWFYSWNEKRNLDWYIVNSGLNAVELNASFYRFPFPNMINSWATKGKGLRWSIKVNRLITHTFKFSDRVWESWRKFYDLFTPLDRLIGCMEEPSGMPIFIAMKNYMEYLRKS